MRRRRLREALWRKRKKEKEDGVPMKEEDTISEETKEALEAITSKTEIEDNTLEETSVQKEKEGSKEKPIEKQDKKTKKKKKKK